MYRKRARSMKKINITINRGDKKQHPVEVEPVKEVVSSEEPLSIESNDSVQPPTDEDLYAKELEIILEEYIKFTKTYKDITKQMVNPIKMRKNAGKIYKQLSDMGHHFNQIVATFKERAKPADDLQEIHEQLLTSLSYFEVYNNEFPDLMRKGNFKRINEVSRGLDTGHKGIKAVFDALEEREQNKPQNQ